MAALTDLAARLDDLIKHSPAADLEKNARAQLVAALANQGLVTREEFDAQKALLDRARAQLAELEAKLAALESKAGQK